MAFAVSVSEPPQPAARAAASKSGAMENRRGDVCTGESLLESRGFYCHSPLRQPCSAGGESPDGRGERSEGREKRRLRGTPFRRGHAVWAGEAPFVPVRASLSAEFSSSAGYGLPLNDFCAVWPGTGLPLSKRVFPNRGPGGPPFGASPYSSGLPRTISAPPRAAFSAAPPSGVPPPVRRSPRPAERYWISIRRPLCCSSRVGIGMVTSRTPSLKLARTWSGLVPSGSGIVR